MSLHTRFSALASQLLSLIDAGKKLDIGETHEHIRDKTLFAWLQDKFPGKIDLSLHEQGDLAQMSELFSTWSHIVDERRKMGIKKNGLCLLIAYCIEGFEADPNTVQSPS